MNRPRGAALPETAVMLGTALTLLFGTFELGTIGYTQLSADGAAYTAAHASMLGNDAAAAVQGPFPQIAAAGGTVSTAQNAPDSTDMPVDYQVANPSNRHGGAQVVRPAHLQTTVSVPQGTGADGLAFGDTLKSLTLGGGFIEGSMMVSAPGYNLDSADINSQTTYNGQKTYFNDDGNAPPYFIGFRLMYSCEAVNPGGGGCATERLHSLGMAEFLDADNWSLGGNGTAAGAVYQAMSAHYAVYANLWSRLPAHALSGKTGIDPQGGNAAGQCVYTMQQWDVVAPPRSTDPRQYPFNPMWSNGTC